MASQGKQILKETEDFLLEVESLPAEQQIVALGERYFGNKKAAEKCDEENKALKPVIVDKLEKMDCDEYICNDLFMLLLIQDYNLPKDIKEAEKTFWKIAKAIGAELAAKIYKRVVRVIPRQVIPRHEEHTWEIDKEVLEKETNSKQKKKILSILETTPTLRTPPPSKRAKEGKPRK